MVETRACDVHRLAKGDDTPREVRYCPLCESWICDECRPLWTIRGIAALKKWAQGVRKG